MNKFLDEHSNLNPKIKYYDQYIDKFDNFHPNEEYKFSDSELVCTFYDFDADKSGSLD